MEGDSQDISAFSALTFDDVVRYSKDKSSCNSASEAYKFMAESGYLHDIKGKYHVFECTRI